MALHQLTGALRPVGQRAVPHGPTHAQAAEVAASTASFRHRLDPPILTAMKGKDIGTFTIHDELPHLARKGLSDETIKTHQKLLAAVRDDIPVGDACLPLAEALVRAG